MSDTQPRPDWWRASDGKWYAPGLHPSYRPSAIPAQPCGASAEIGVGQPSSSVEAVSPKQADSPKKRRSGLIVAGSMVVGLVLIIFIVATTNQESIPTAATATTAIPAPAAASATSPPATIPPATAPPPTTPPVTAPSLRAPLATASGKVHVGAALALRGSDGSKVSGTLNQVIDPATGIGGPLTDSNGKPTNSGYVATVITILDTGSTAIRDDANDDASLIGSDGRNYMSDSDAVHQCTNFNSGEYSIGPGEKARQSVAWSLLCRSELPRQSSSGPQLGSRMTLASG